MDRSAIILAGGLSSRFGEDKGLVELNGKCLIQHAVDNIKSLVDEVIVVTDSKERADLYAKLIHAKNVQFITDLTEAKAPLIGAYTGFQAAKGDYSLVVAYDAPFISKQIVSFLFECCIGKAAAIPRWPDNQIEPLHAVYNTCIAREASRKAVETGELSMHEMIGQLRGVRYISTLVIEQVDPEMKTFFNINTRLDLKKALTLSNSKRQKNLKDKPNKAIKGN